SVRAPMNETSPPDSPQAAGPAQRSGPGWQQGPLARLEEFVEGTGSLPPSEVAAALREDLRARWQRGERVRVEDYLRRRRALPDAAEAARDLVPGEASARKEAGEPAPREEYLSRFPRFSAQLRRRFARPEAATGQTTVTDAGPPAAPPRPPERIGKYVIV